MFSKIACLFAIIFFIACQSNAENESRPNNTKECKYNQVYTLAVSEKYAEKWLKITSALSVVDGISWNGLPPGENVLRRSYIFFTFWFRRHFLSKSTVYEIVMYGWSVPYLFISLYKKNVLITIAGHLACGTSWFYVWRKKCQKILILL